MLSSIFSIPTRRARIDFGATFGDIDGLFYERGLRSAPLAQDLAIARGRLGITMATKSFEGERVARAIISHTSAAPLYEGLTVIAHPRPELDAPLLIAEVSVTPAGVTRAFLDACGSTAGEFDALFRKPLSQTLDAAVASAVRRKRVPEWVDRISSGAGARLAANPGRGHVIAYALLRYCERWFEGLEAAGAASDPSANAAATRAACDTFRTHGRGARRMSRAFGEELAARWAGLVWNV